MQWGREEFVAAVDPARRLKLDVRLVGYWLEGKLPSNKYAEPILNAFFGTECRYRDWKSSLQTTLTRAREERGPRLRPRTLPDLPHPIASFTGRETALRRLRALLSVNSASLDGGPRDRQDRARKRICSTMPGSLQGYLVVRRRESLWQTLLSLGSPLASSGGGTLSRGNGTGSASPPAKGLAPRL